MYTTVCTVYLEEVAVFGIAYLYIRMFGFNPKKSFTTARKLPRELTIQTFCGTVNVESTSSSDIKTRTYFTPNPY